MICVQEIFEIREGLKKNINVKVKKVITVPWGWRWGGGVICVVSPKNNNFLTFP